MAFERKDYGRNKDVPFRKIADRAEVTVDLKGKRVSGPRWSLSNRQPVTLPAAALRRELWSMVDKESVNAATETTNHRWSAVSPFVDPFKMEIQ